MVFFAEALEPHEPTPVYVAWTVVFLLIVILNLNEPAPSTGTGPNVAAPALSDTF